MRTCSKCHIPKPISDFHRQASCPEGRRPDCKKCRCAQQRDRHRLTVAEDPRRALAIVLRRLLVAELRARGYEWCSTGQHAVDPGLMGYVRGTPNGRCKPCAAKLANCYYHEVIKIDPERYAKKLDYNFSSNTARMQRFEAAFVEMIDRTVVWKRDEGVCGLCKEPADSLKWHLDHVVPLARGGRHEYSNVRVTHPACNLRKNAKLDEELMAAAPVL